MKRDRDFSDAINRNLSFYDIVINFTFFKMIIIVIKIGYGVNLSNKNYSCKYSILICHNIRLFERNKEKTSTVIVIYPLCINTFLVF